MPLLTPADIDAFYGCTVPPVCRRWHRRPEDPLSLESGPCRPGIVYVARLLGQLKIGYTEKPLEERMIALQNRYGCLKAEAVAAFRVACGLGAETYLHDRFQSHRLDGEFFDLTEADLRQLASFTEFNGQPVERIR